MVRTKQQTNALVFCDDSCSCCTYSATPAQPILRCTCSCSSFLALGTTSSQGLTHNTCTIACIFVLPKRSDTVLNLGQERRKLLHKVPQPAQLLLYKPIELQQTSSNKAHYQQQTNKSNRPCYSCMTRNKQAAMPPAGAASICSSTGTTICYVAPADQAYCFSCAVLLH
jgi:hypothetical protein